MTVKATRFARLAKTGKSCSLHSGWTRRCLLRQFIGLKCWNGPMPLQAPWRCCCVFHGFFPHLLPPAAVSASRQPVFYPKHLFAVHAVPVLVAQIQGQATGVQKGRSGGADGWARRSLRRGGSPSTLAAPGKRHGDEAVFFGCLRRHGQLQMRAGRTTEVRRQRCSHFLQWWGGQTELGNGQGVGGR